MDYIFRNLHVLFFELLAPFSSGLTAVSGGALNVTSAASDVMAREGRPNKKSKWDKVHLLEYGLFFKKITSLR